MIELYDGGHGLMRDGVDAYRGESIGDLMPLIQEIGKRLVPVQQERCWCGALYLQSDLRCPKGHCTRCAED